MQSPTNSPDFGDNYDGYDQGHDDEFNIVRAPTMFSAQQIGLDADNNYPNDIFYAFHEEYKRSEGEASQHLDPDHK